MIAVVIVGLMAGVVTYATIGMLDRAKHKRVGADFSTISGAIEIFHGEAGRFPTNQEGLSVIKDLKVRNDPWGHPYQYVQPGRGNAPYDLICYGADGREGGTGADADVTSNDPEFQGGAAKK
jgi:general secretion pathway protein G